MPNNTALSSLIGQEAADILERFGFEVVPTRTLQRILERGGEYSLSYAALREYWDAQIDMAARVLLCKKEGLPVYGPCGRMHWLEEKEL